MYEQLDFAQPLAEKILGYLRENPGYQTPRDIADSIGASVDVVADECARLYWDRAHLLSRTVRDSSRVCTFPFYRLDP